MHFLSLVRKPKPDEREVKESFTGTSGALDIADDIAVFTKESHMSRDHISVPL